MKTIHTTPLLLLMSFSLVSSAQQVPLRNDSYVSSCNMHDHIPMSSVDGWSNANGGSADIYNTKACKYTVGIPENAMGHQAAPKGESYAGIVAGYEDGTFDPSRFFIDGFSAEKVGYGRYSEYLEGELAEPLKAGELYRVTFRVSLADKSGRAISGLGAYLSTTPVAEASNARLSLEPQISSPNVITDSTGWTEISGTFMAKGGEKYITIGAFDKNYRMEDITGPLQMDNRKAYYYIAGGITVAGGRVDSDNDGVTDDMDDCPNTKGLSQLRGCPDRDGDGIADKDDRCPDTKGVIAMNGCPQ